jgi:hypothetical protein
MSRDNDVNTLGAEVVAAYGTPTMLRACLRALVFVPVASAGTPTQRGAFDDEDSRPLMLDREATNATFRAELQRLLAESELLTRSGSCDPLKRSDMSEPTVGNGARA